MNRLSKVSEEKIITLFLAGHTAEWISEHLDIHRETVSTYVKNAGYVLKRGRPPTRESKPTIKRDKVPPEEIPKPTISSQGCPPTNSQSQCSDFRDFIKERVKRGVSAKVIWQDLVDETSFCGAYDSVKRFVRKLRGSNPEVFAVIPTKPGEEAQVDYGKGAMTRNPKTGKYKRPWLFCMKLSHSRKAFRKVVWKSSSQVWVELHEEAFRFFRGVPLTIKLDNLKEGVLKADFYDPELNPLYENFLKYYGCVALPCRVATPRLKGKVESEVKYTQNALKGRKFETIEEQNRYLKKWDERWASTRIHGTIKRQVREVFETEEQPALITLPLEGYPIIKILKRKVHPDGHIMIDHAFYSVPHTWVGKDVVVHVGRFFIKVYHPVTGELLSKHTVSQAGRFNTRQEHLPDNKRLHGNHQKLIKRASAIGENTTFMVRSILKHEPYRSIRQIHGIFAFTRKYPAARIEAAAGSCIQKNLVTYRALKNFLQHTEKDTKQLNLNLSQQHSLIRSISHYQTIWMNQIKGEESC